MSSFKFRFYVKPLSPAAKSALLNLMTQSAQDAGQLEPCCIEVYFESVSDVYEVSEAVLDQFVRLPCARGSRAYSQAYGRTILPLALFKKLVERGSDHVMTQS